MVRLTKKKIFIIFGTVILAGGAAAGGVILYNTLVKKHADLGMSKAEVLKKLGDPDHTSEKGETWYYFESGIGKKFKEKDELEHSWNEANQIKAQTIGLEIETKHFESRTIEFDSDNKVVSYLYDSDTKYTYDGESFSSWANKELKEIKTTLKDDLQCYKVSENKSISRFALSNFEDKLSYEATFTDKSLLKVADQRSFSLEGPDKKNISLKCEFTKEIQIETKLNIQAYDSKVEVYYEPKQVTIEGDGLYNIGDEAHLKATPKTGYKVDGWYDHSDSTKSNILSDQNEYNPTIETFGRLSLDVWCSKEIYKITYELNGGTNHPQNPHVYTIDSEFELQNPSKEHNTFLGWYIGDEKVTDIKKGTIGDITITARFEPDKFNITLNPGEGTINQSTLILAYGKEYSLPSPTPKSSEKMFKEWEYNSTTIPTTGIWNIADDIELTAVYLEAIHVTLDPNGGLLDNVVFNTFESLEYTLPSPVRVGYDFAGWYHGSQLVSLTGHWDYSDISSLQAHWTPIKYTITYILNGGTNNSSNPSKYTIEQNVVFKAPTKQGYTFAGWFNNSTQITNISVGTTGSITIEAHWTGNLNNLSVTSEDTSKGTVAITSGSGYSGELITVQASPMGNNSFKGWYHNSTKVSINEVYTFTMPASDYSLVAQFYTEEEKYAYTPLLSGDGKTITYGLYPQTNVNDADLIASLDGLTTPESNGLYLYEDTYYAKTNASLYVYATNYVFDNGDLIEDGATYWFKCEPITWNVLSNNDGEYYILSSVLLDAHCYYKSRDERTIDEQTIYPNNYKYSDIREWLNNDFYQTAFALGNSNIQTTTVDNSAATTNRQNNPYICDNTQDKVFLPSYKDYINTSYGFSNDPSSHDSIRECKTTDWARARGAYYFGKYKGCYWTRSPYSFFSNNISDEAWGVTSSGYIDGDDVRLTNMSVRPCLSIKIA